MTQTAQHTPGPWGNISHSEHAGFLIKTNDCWKRATDADKSLMIAAPELLEALRYIDNHCRERWAQDEKYRAGISYVLDAAGTAIAKATGA